jgi:hypothetical protein
VSLGRWLDMDPAHAQHGPRLAAANLHLPATLAH